MLWRCKDCGTLMAVGIKRCPHCNRNHIDKGDNVAKTTAHGEGAKGTNALDPEYRAEQGFDQLDPTGQKPNEELLDDNGEVDRSGIGEVGRERGAESSPGNSSPKSTEKPESSSGKKQGESPSPAPTTAQSSTATKKASSAAGSAGGATPRGKK